MKQLVYEIVVTVARIREQTSARREEEMKQREKNSKHVFALMVFNKQYLNVNYCDYFV